HFSALDQSCQICWSSFPAKIYRPRCGSGDLVAARSIAFRTRQSDRKSFPKKLARHACKSFDGPVLCFPNRPRHKNNKRFASRHTVLIEQSVDVVDCFRREVDCQVRRFIIETKQKSDPQVTIYRVNIERWNGNAVSVRDPGTFTGATPAAVRDVLEIVLGRNCAREFDRPIKPDAHSRAADQREQSGPHLAMHVDHQIVFRAPDLFEQIKKAERSAPSLARFREFASSEENHTRERGMMTDDLRILRRDQPVNARTRITRT